MSVARQAAGRGAARRPGAALERRFPLPAWNEANERRYGRQLEVVAGFYSARDPGRDLRAELGLRKGLNDWFVDLRVWIAGQPVATRNGLRVSLADWPAFAELVRIVDQALAARGVLTAEPRTPQP